MDFDRRWVESAQGRTPHSSSYTAALTYQSTSTASRLLPTNVLIASLISQFVSDYNDLQSLHPACLFHFGHPGCSRIALRTEAQTGQRLRCGSRYVISTLSYEPSLSFVRTCLNKRIYTQAVHFLVYKRYCFIFRHGGNS